MIYEKLQSLVIHNISITCGKLLYFNILSTKTPLFQQINDTILKFQLKCCRKC